MQANNFFAKQSVTLLFLTIGYYFLIDLQSAYDKTEITSVGKWLLFFADVSVAWVFVNIIHYLFGLIFNKQGVLSYIFVAVIGCFYVVLDRVAMTTFDQHISLALWEAAYFAITFNELHLSYKTFLFSITIFVVLSAVAWLQYKLVYRLIPENKKIPLRFSIFIFLQLNLAFWLVNSAVYVVKDEERLRYLLPFSDFFNVARWVDDNELTYPELRTNGALRKSQMICVKEELENNKAVSFNKPKNILFITAESLRSTMLDEKRMPHLNALAKQENVLNLKNHYSTANATSTGVFGLMSGINGLYYMDAKKQKLRMPPLVLLENAGYQFNLYASRDIHYADVYNFIFSYLDHTLHTEYEKKVALADAQLIKDFEQSLKESGSAPRFDFLFLYSTHYDYFYTDKHRIFLPDVNKGLANTEVPNIFKGKDTYYVLYNRYQNAAHYVDSLVMQAIDVINKHSNLEDWIIVFTGDHGEELGEYGQLGHSFGFRQEQIKVPALMIFPEPNAPKVEYQTTGHEDLLPSLLSYMEINIDLEKLTTGKNLFKYKSERDFATSIANMMSFDTRYTQVIINKDKKLRIDDREYPRVQKVLNLNDEQVLDVKKESLLPSIKQYHDMTMKLPGDC